MKKDFLREYLSVAVEAYDLSSTPQPSFAYIPSPDETEPLDAPVMFVTSRKAQLDFGIDIKIIYDSFINSIKKKYGPDRADRFTTWVKVGYIEQFHSDHRLQIKWDRSDLIRKMRASLIRHTK